MSEPVAFPVDTIDIEDAYPYLRSIENTSTGILANPYWSKLKSVLTDANYYDKTAFALPYCKDEIYELQGYLGVSNCNMDVYINDIYNHTTSTGAFGEFTVKFPFPKGITTVTLQARDKFNIKFSRKSAPYSIRTLNIYTWYAILGEQYTDINEEATLQQLDISLTESRNSSFEDRFSPFINLYKHGDEDEDKFRAIASVVYKAFEFASYRRAIETTLDAFRDNVDEFDHYRVYYNEDLYNTQKTAFTYTLTSTGMNRNNYYYGVSAGTNDGGETTITPLRVDRRWWPEGYKNENILQWEYVEGADYYKVYRGETSTGLHYISKTPYNFFNDIGLISPRITRSPQVFNFTGLVSPENLMLYDAYTVNNLFLRLKKPTSLVILIYGKDNLELPEYNTQRIIALLEKFIPPEIKYKLIFSNNDKIILYPEGSEVDLTEPTLVYGRYDHSYYDGTEVYAQ